MALLLLLACQPDLDGASDCPGLDCRDELTLQVFSPDGSPSTSFAGALTPPDADPIALACHAPGDSFDGGYCDGDGKVRIWTYAESYALTVYEGMDAPYWSGTITPAWTAPYDSDECGHYCWIAEEAVLLEPCEGCG